MPLHDATTPQRDAHDAGGDGAMQEGVSVILVREKERDGAAHLPTLPLGIGRHR
jgi:hypothetical protein